MLVFEFVRADVKNRRFFLEGALHYDGTVIGAAGGELASKWESGSREAILNKSRGRGGPGRRRRFKTEVGIFY